MARFVKEVGRNYNQFTPEDGPGSGTVTSVALTAPTGFTVSGSPIVSAGTLALSFTTGYGIPPLMTGNAGRFLTTNGTTMSWANIAGTDVTGAALTETDDTNVTMTLGGTPATALLRSVSMTLGWAGQLAVSRGGTGAATLTGVLIGNGTSAVSAVVGGPNQILRRNSGGTAYEFFTASFLTNPMTLNFDMIYQAGGVPTRLAGPTSTTKQFLTAVGDGTNTTSLAWGTIAATDISAAALTKVDDTNVTLTLGGTPATSLIRAVSLTLGWSGTLSAGRGGTGTSGVSGIMLGNSTAPVTGITGIGGQILRANPSTGAYEFWTPTYLQSPMTTAGDLITANAGGAPIRLAANTSADNLFLRTVSGAIGYAAIQGTDVVGAAITTANDTNITITASGNTTNALLRTLTLTAGWSGALSPARGGTGATTLTGVVIGSGIGTMVGVAGTANQLLRRNSANTAYEFWTATYMNNPFTTGGDLVVSNSAGAPLRLAGNTSTTRRYLSQIGDGTSVTSTSWETISGGVGGSGTINYVPKWTSSSNLGDSQILDNGTNIGIGDASPSVLIDAYKATGGIIRIRSGAGGAFYVSNSTKTSTVAAFGDAGGIIGGAADTTAMVYSGNVPLSIYVNSAERARFLTTGEVGIGTATPTHKLEVIGVISAGNVTATNGSIMLQDNYPNSHFGNIGTMFSGANLMLGYGVTPSGSSATAFLSSVFISGTPFSRSSIVVGEDVSIYTGSSQSVAIGSSVTMSERFRMENNGRLRLNAYTSSSSFTGIAAGYLAFTSGGIIITTATPGGVSGTQNVLAKFDSTGIAVGNSRIVDDGTNFLLNSASSYVTGLNIIGDIGMQSASGQASSILMRSNRIPTSGTTIGIIDSLAITTGTTYVQGGGFEFRASQNWGSTSAGTNIFVQTAPDNTVAAADMFVFLNNGAVRFIGRTSNPISPAAGTMYYNSSANNMRYFNGSSWITF